MRTGAAAALTGSHAEIDADTIPDIAQSGSRTH